MEFYYLMGALTSAIVCFTSIRLYWIMGEDSARHKTTGFGKFMLGVFAISFLMSIILLAYYMKAAT